MQRKEVENAAENDSKEAKGKTDKKAVEEKTTNKIFEGKVNVQDLKLGLKHDPWLPFENLVLQPPYCLVKQGTGQGELLKIEYMYDPKLKMAEKDAVCAIEDNALAL